MDKANTSGAHNKDPANIQQRIIKLFRKWLLETMSLINIMMAIPAIADKKTHKVFPKAYFAKL